MRAGREKLLLRRYGYLYSKGVLRSYNAFVESFGQLLDNTYNQSSNQDNIYHHITIIVLDYLFITFVPLKVPSYEGLLD